MVQARSEEMAEEEAMVVEAEEATAAVEVVEEAPEEEPVAEEAPAVEEDAKPARKPRRVLPLKKSGAMDKTPGLRRRWLNGRVTPGGHGPVLTMSMMGISALIIGTLIDPIAGLVPLFGILCLMTSVFLGYFLRTSSTGPFHEPMACLCPHDGHAMFCEGSGRATPNQRASIQRTN